MRSTHPNIAVLQQFNPADIPASLGIIAEDAVFHYYNPILPEMAGDYHGREGFAKFFGTLAAKTEGTFQVTPRSITPMGNELVVTHVTDHMQIEGQQIAVDAVVVWRIVDGSIKEAWDIPAVYTAVTSNC